MTETAKHPAVEMRNITKRFPGVIANQDVDLTVYAGEIHALLGENGAGKSTLMSALAGLYRPDVGEIFLATKGNTRPKRVDIGSPKDAIDLGIGMVHQHFKLVRPQTVAENIVLGLDKPRFVLNMARVEREIETISKQYRMHVDPAALVWQLSVGEQQRIEILKLLYRGADVLILDEPTAVLTPQESDELGQTLRRMADEGKAIIFITHKLDEVISFADKVTVLRDGKNVASRPIEGVTKAELARLMVGREVLFRIDKDPMEAGSVALSVRQVQALNDKGLPALRGISFEIHSGEILGVAGVAGNGQRELAQVITGLRHSTTGQVFVHGKELTNQSSRRFIQEGVSHIPGDRLGTGLAGNLPVSDNMIMKAYRRQPISAGPFLRNNAVVKFTRRLIDAFQIATPSYATPARMLSGGNQQKAILAREITAGEELSEDNPAVLVAVHPTRGLDVGATEAVRAALLEQRRQGTAILLVSEDLDELLALSDKVAVIYEGQFMGIVPSDEANVEELGLMMAGDKEVKGAEAQAA